MTGAAVDSIVWASALVAIVALVCGTVIVVSLKG
jgi:hypothetical protein